MFYYIMLCFQEFYHNINYLSLEDHLMCTREVLRKWHNKMAIVLEKIALGYKVAHFFLVDGFLLLKTALGSGGNGIRACGDAIFYFFFQKALLTLSTLFLFFINISQFFYIGKWCPNLLKIDEIVLQVV